MFLFQRKYLVIQIGVFYKAGYPLEVDLIDDEQTVKKKLNSAYKRYKSEPITIRAAIIGGMFAILAVLIGNALSFILDQTTTEESEPQQQEIIEEEPSSFFRARIIDSVTESGIPRVLIVVKEVNGVFTEMEHELSSTDGFFELIVPLNKALFKK